MPLLLIAFCCVTAGIVTLTEDHTVCEKGSTLTPEQCRILVRARLVVDRGETFGEVHTRACTYVYSATHTHTCLSVLVCACVRAFVHVCVWTSVTV